MIFIRKDRLFEEGARPQKRLIFAKMTGNGREVDKISFSLLKNAEKLRQQSHFMIIIKR